MRIGIDIDGVLYPWTDAANAAVMARFGVADPGPHLHWDHLLEQVGPERFGWLWTPEGQAVAFGRVDSIYPGAAEAFGAVLASGHECHFVTHRDPVLAGAATVAYLGHHFAGHRWAGTHVVKSTPKHDLASWSVFIDDKVETVRDMLAWTDAQVFAPARPWNEELAELTTPRFIRYSNPLEVSRWLAING